MTDVCREMGVRTDIPFKDLTDQEKEIVYHGPAEKKHIFYKAKKIVIRQENWILLIIMQSIRLKMPWQR